MEFEVGVVERRYKALRRHLDDLGYRQPLAVDSLPLVERIVADLLHTTESLQHYKSLAQKSLEECSHLGIGVEPYKIDNAKLVQANNELHLKLLYQKEETEKSQKDLKVRLRKLESENSDLQFLNSQYLSRVKTVELESAEKTRKILHLHGKNCQANVTTPGGKRNVLPLRRPTLDIDAPLKPGKPWQERFWSVHAQASDPHIVNICDMADQRIKCMCRELELRKEENNQLAEVAATYRNQLNSRDREIQRLNSMLATGRPVNAVSNQCCCRDLKDEYNKLEKMNKEIECQLKEAVSKQHEAMNRAVRLSDRNKQLEKEMKDIDRLALSVQAECNSAVKDNTKQVSKIQKNLEDSLKQIHSLEREVLELKRSSQESHAEFDKMRNEKQNLQKLLESCLDEKKPLTEKIIDLERQLMELKRSSQEALEEVEKVRSEKVDVQKLFDTCQDEKKELSNRINQLTIIEKGLNKEIERLTQATSLQTRRIAELESQLKTSEAEKQASNSAAAAAAATASRRPSNGAPKNGAPKNVAPKNVAPKNGGKSSERSGKSLNEKKSSKELIPPESQAKDRPDGCRCQNYPDRCQCSHAVSQEAIAKTLEAQEQLINRLQTERDHYSREYHRMQEQLGSSARKDDDEKVLRRKLCEAKESLRDLVSENQNLKMRLEASHVRSSAPSPQDNTSTIKKALARTERERDEARSDVRRLEEERNALRERLQIATETQLSEHSRFEQMVLEAEERVRKIESERRDTLNSQGSLRGQMNNMQSQLEEARESLRTTQHELAQQRILYNQIKALHEQTDRALADSQGQLTRTESDLEQSHDRVRELERSRAALDREVAQLKSERTALKASISHVDQEKDGLLIEMDEKTEKVASLIHELKTKENKLVSMHEKLCDLQKKLDIVLEENAAKEQAARRCECEVQALRQDLCTAQRTNETTLRENRRLCDDLTAATHDVRLAQHELEQSRREVENLKRQLQEYVAEVRRVEELLNQKECERTELLDHFRSLSLEATVLETNNHSLGHEAEEAKTCLQKAEDRLTDLELRLEAKDSMLAGYEEQLAELTAAVACLESRLIAQTEQKDRLETDISAVRDLCVKLDSQKDDLMEAHAESDAMKMELDSELIRLRSELCKDQATINSLEECLAVSRQETMEGRRDNQELQAEVATLHRRIDDLQQRLDCESSEVRRYQTQASEYGQQVSELRREVTNERFERARISEESRRSGDSGCNCARPSPRITPVTHATGVELPNPVFKPFSRLRPSVECPCDPAARTRTLDSSGTSYKRLPDYSATRPSYVPPSREQERRSSCLCSPRQPFESAKLPDEIVSTVREVERAEDSEEDTSTELPETSENRVSEEILINIKLLQACLEDSALNSRPLPEASATQPRNSRPLPEASATQPRKSQSSARGSVLRDINLRSPKVPKIPEKNVPTGKIDAMRKFYEGQTNDHLQALPDDTEVNPTRPLVKQSQQKTNLAQLKIIQPQKTSSPKRKFSDYKKSRKPSLTAKTPSTNPSPTNSQTSSRRSSVNSQDTRMAQKGSPNKPKNVTQ